MCIYIYISMIKTNQHEWIIFKAVDSRRNTNMEKGEVSAEICRKEACGVELGERIRERARNENVIGLR
jgi:hypothetical protein